MKILDTNAQLNDLYANAAEIAKQAGFDPTEDEFKIVQPFADHNFIMLSAVEEDGERTIKVEVSDGLIILPAKPGTLDVFQDDEQ